MKRHYNIVEITKHTQLLRYKDYTEWCIIFTEMAYEYCLDFGKRHLYILERDDYRSLRPTKGKDYPYDTYGMSLIAVVINNDGTAASVTTRWNSLEEDEEDNDIGHLCGLLGDCTYSYNDDTTENKH